MPAIPWSEFEKEELVELLGELETCGYVTSPLWSESNVHYVADCTCAPKEAPLPGRVLEIRDRVIARRGRSAGTPVKTLIDFLRQPFRRSTDADRTEKRA